MKERKNKETGRKGTGWYRRGLKRRREEIETLDQGPASLTMF